MDLLKLENAFRKKMKLSQVIETHEEGERKGYEILNNNNIDLFQEKMREYEVSFLELKEFYNIYSEVYLDNKQIDITPSFYIDFDSKMFISYFSEPGSYEDFIPNDWNGKYERAEHFLKMKTFLSL